jgi:hypothetical protein
MAQQHEAERALRRQRLRDAPPPHCPDRGEHAEQHCTLHQRGARRALRARQAQQRQAEQRAGAEQCDRTHVEVRDDEVEADGTQQPSPRGRR